MSKRSQSPQAKKDSLSGCEPSWLELEVKRERGHDGFVYIIALDPESLPGRVKVGWAKSLADRMSAHATTNPRQRLIGSWSGNKYDEELILSTARILGTPVGGPRSEVFDVPSIVRFGRQVHSQLRPRTTRRK